MKVLVTGGIGTVGKAVLERLLRNGWDVRVVDRKPEFEMAGIDYQVCDITNYDDLREKMRGCEVVVHLAAIPSPMFVPPVELFHINVQGTYNVYEAAAAEGIRRLVQASSINAFGCFWGNREICPDYFPIDEEHATATTDVYSFSKEVVEDIGTYYWRRNGISSLSLRFPGVMSLARYASDEAKAHQAQTRAAIDEFAAQPQAERAERLAKLRQATVEFRKKGSMEYPLAPQSFREGGYSDDPLWRAYAFDRFNFWAYVDERDAAQSIEKGLTAPFEGHHALFINAQNNSLNYDSEALVKLFFPEVDQWKRPLQGSESLVSYAKAQSLIGYKPEYSV
ncbi:MAG: NAD(P)-dependent oxidoreductase [Caldilineaceae bacterium]|nr:NAD(P)-dependent oxidoreductase [Caldilineaceae bacterium]